MQWESTWNLASCLKRGPFRVTRFTRFLSVSTKQSLSFSFIHPLNTALYSLEYIILRYLSKWYLAIFLVLLCFLCLKGREDNNKNQLAVAKSKSQDASFVLESLPFLCRAERPNGQGGACVFSTSLVC
jgi:hypothetical protein